MYQKSCEGDAHAFNFSPHPFFNALLPTWFFQPTPTSVPASWIFWKGMCVHLISSGKKPRSAFCYLCAYFNLPAKGSKTAKCQQSSKQLYTVKHNSKITPTILNYQFKARVRLKRNVWSPVTWYNSKQDEIHNMEETQERIWPDRWTFIIKCIHTEK